MIRLYRAVCGLIEAHADSLAQDDPPPQPDGADALVERSGQHEPDELSSHYHRDEDEFWEDRRRGFNMPRSNR